MPVSPENLAFSERLRSALKRLPKQVLTAAALAHEFNLRWDKGEPVTPQATRKWLSGEARPSVDKIEILSGWLGVSSHWLQYGPAAPGKRASPAKRGQPGQLSEAETKLLARLRVLSEYQVRLIGELVDQLATEREASGGTALG